MQSSAIYSALLHAYMYRYDFDLYALIFTPFSKCSTGEVCTSPN